MDGQTLIQTSWLVIRFYLSSLIIPESKDHAIAEKAKKSYNNIASMIFQLGDDERVELEVFK